VDMGSYPEGSDGLRALLQRPANSESWRGPYLKQDDIPLDPWQHPYIYEYPGRYNEGRYDLMSMGPDGRAGTNDDVTNGQSGKTAQAGISLIELILVMAILTMVAAVAVPHLSGFASGRIYDGEWNRFNAVLRYARTRPFRAPSRWKSVSTRSKEVTEL